WAKVSCGAGYMVQYKVSTSTTWITQTAITNPSTSSYQLSGLTPGTTYNYRVITKCATGLYSSSSNTKSFTTLPFRLDGLANDEDENNSEQISIAPNPVSDKLQISFDAEVTNADLKIINITGEVILAKTFAAVDGTFDEQVDVSSFPSGIYFLRIGMHIPPTYI